MFFFTKKSKEQKTVVTPDPIKVCLYGLFDMGLIVPASTNIFYYNQTAGYGVFHQQQEGIFVPIATADSRKDERHDLLSLELIDYFFRGPKWGGHCARIDEETADFMDAAFLKYGHTKSFRVDRTKFDQSHEAWVHITLDCPQQKTWMFSGITPFPKTAILTWPNSD